MLETTKLLGSTQSKITKDKNCKNLPHLEITEIILVHCNINSVYQQDQKSCVHLFLINNLVKF